MRLEAPGFGIIHTEHLVTADDVERLMRSFELQVSALLLDSDRSLREFDYEAAAGQSGDATALALALAVLADELADRQAAGL